MAKVVAFEILPATHPATAVRMTHTTGRLPSRVILNDEGRWV